MLMSETARMNTEAQSNHNLRHHRKIADIPTAITDLGVLQKYRSAQYTVESKRGSLYLQKIKPPDYLSRRNPTPIPTFEVLKSIEKRPVDKDGVKIKKTKTPMTLKKPMSSIDKSATKSSSSSASSANINIFSAMKRLNQSKTSNLNRVPWYEMDLSYLEPYGSIGLFSTAGVTGKKARTTSYSEGLRNYRTLKDVSSLNDNRDPSNLLGSRLRGSVSDLLDDIRATLRAPLSLESNAKSFTSKEIKTERTTPNVSSKGNDRTASKAAPHRVSIPRRSLKKHVATKKASTKTTSNDRSAKSSSPEQRKVDNTTECRPAVIHVKPPRREVRTQTTDDEMEQFEVMAFL